ncbi:MAG: AAA family ATPase, partial [Anaerovoracaceae bacterium]
KETIKTKCRPIVIITSNAEKELPDAFLRRCIFHYIDFPEKEKMEEIIKVHYGDIDEKLVDLALEKFYDIREMHDLQKKPSTSELLDWLQALMISGIKLEKKVKDLPFIGVLLKKNQDMDMLKEINEKGYTLRRW